MRYVILLAALAACTTPDMIKSSAEDNAWEFAADMGIEVVGVSCSGRDTDRDGDTSCTLNTGGDTRINIECNYDVAFAPLGQATGCKQVVFARGFEPAE